MRPGSSSPLASRLASPFSGERVGEASLLYRTLPAGASKIVLDEWRDESREPRAETVMDRRSSVCGQSNESRAVRGVRLKADGKGVGRGLREPWAGMHRGPPLQDKGSGFRSGWRAVARRNKRENARVPLLPVPDYRAASQRPLGKGEGGTFECTRDSRCRQTRAQRNRVARRTRPRTRKRENTARD